MELAKQMINNADLILRAEKLQAQKEANDKKIKEIKEATSYYSSSKSGSLAEKAGMVARYNEKNNKKN